MPGIPQSARLSNQPRTHRSIPRVFVATAATLAMVATGMVTGLVATASAATPASASTSHPYSDPVWFPLRKDTIISCFKDTPGAGCDDVHDAYQLLLDAPHGRKNDPVYASGAGIVHIGAEVSNACRAKAPATSGTWIWVDHGAGVVSKYEHLASINIREGQYVTPATQIGVMGHSGNWGKTCDDQPYLDFQIRHGGIHGSTVHFTHLKACVNGSAKFWPNQLKNSRGNVYTDFDDIPYRTETTATSDSSCLPAAAPRTSAAPAKLEASPRSSSVDLSWSGPSGGSGMDQLMIEQELYHPSTKAWGTRTYRARTSATDTTYNHLDNGRSYRFRVTFHNGAGWSKYTSWSTAVPAGTPGAPKSAKLSTTHHSAGFDWARPSTHGASITGYEVKFRHKSNGKWTGWTSYEVDARSTFKHWSGLTSGKYYQAKVRAKSSAGSSDWAFSKSVQTQG